ncbi:MAG: hypothetical protein EXR79_11785 [Myxococcales bacterium]|nr:hypothetical protein [Myxococcales bacterium]
MDVDTAIRTRRSHKLFDGTAVPTAMLADLVELATWAPNHKRTEPWRFSVLTADRVGLLPERIDAALADGTLPAHKATKLRQVVAGLGAAIAVSWVRTPADPERDREDYAAACCAVQNLMLAAHARGIASYWTTSGAFVGAHLRDFWQLAPNEEFVGAVLLGGAAIEMPAVRTRGVADVARWI